MASFNFSTKQMAAKIVYYGPGLCGKTTSLKYIFDHTSGEARGKMVSLATETDRTLFFDLLPLEVGRVAGFQTRIQLYTVPGQVFYNSTRRLVLKGVDGVVFVADSQTAMLPANLESFRNLEVNLAELGVSIDEIPLVLQYNKRDLKDICSQHELSEALNRKQWPEFETSAINGDGIFETLREVSKRTLLSLKTQLESGGTRLARPQPAAPRPAEPAPAPEQPVAASAPEPTTVVQGVRAPQGAPVAAVRRDDEGGPPPWKGRGSVAAGPPRTEEPLPAPPPPAAAERAAETEASSRVEELASTNGHAAIDRRLVELDLDSAELEQARTLAIDLQVRDARQRVLHQIRDFQWELAEGTAGQKLRFQLEIELNPRGTEE
jgi:signal recognition particle receptor subunit beta